MFHPYDRGVILPVSEPGHWLGRVDRWSKAHGWASDAFDQRRPCAPLIESTPRISPMRTRQPARTAGTPRSTAAQRTRWPERPPGPPEWLQQRLTELDNGDIEALSAAARLNDIVGPKADAVDKAVAYFETNAHRMRYAYYRTHSMFIGSGVVEAGCKSVFGARLKQSGMHWTAAAPPRSPPCAASTRADRPTRPPHSANPTTHREDQQQRRPTNLSRTHPPPSNPQTVGAVA
jgi:hypothetical protein